MKLRPDERKFFCGSTALFFINHGTHAHRKSDNQKGALKKLSAKQSGPAQVLVNNKNIATVILVSFQISIHLTKIDISTLDVFCEKTNKTNASYVERASKAD